MVSEIMRLDRRPHGTQPPFGRTGGNGGAPDGPGGSHDGGGDGCISAQVCSKYRFLTGAGVGAAGGVKREVSIGGGV
jgi:hypothetical protein